MVNKRNNVLKNKYIVHALFRACVFSFAIIQQQEDDSHLEEYLENNEKRSECHRRKTEYSLKSYLRYDVFQRSESIKNYYLKPLSSDAVQRGRRAEGNTGEIMSLI